VIYVALVFPYELVPHVGCCEEILCSTMNISNPSISELFEKDVIKDGGRSDFQQPSAAYSEASADPFNFANRLFLAQNSNRSC
jgi:hypothetical protein